MQGGKIITFGKEAREKIFAGIKETADAVACTYGPHGYNVIIDLVHAEPDITNDGVTVVRGIFFADRYKEMGAYMLKKACGRTNRIAGDGTSATAILAAAIVENGLPYIEDGVSPFALVNGMNRVLCDVTKFVESKAIKIESLDEVEKIAKISSQDEAVAKHIRNAFEAVGNTGTVVVEESQEQGINIEMKNGLEFDEPLKTLHLVTDMKRMQCELENAYIFVTDKKITSLIPIKDLMEDIMKSGKKDIFFICDDIDPGALVNLVYNHKQGLLNVGVCKAPLYGDKKDDFFKDICSLTGATLISESTGLEFKNVMVDHLGVVERVISGRSSTMIIGGKRNEKAVNETIEFLKGELAKTTDEWKVLKLEERMAKLTGGIAKIKVGYPTDMETTNKRMKIEDAVQAVKAAMAEGYTYGEGVTLLDAIKHLADDTIERKIMKKALTIPTKILIDNVGDSGEYVAQKILNEKEDGIGYDTKNKVFTDILKIGIIDPIKVIRVSLENAVSLANMVLSSKCVIVDDSKDDPQDATVQ